MSKRHQRVTIEDVAREAGVSMMTVSRVINGKGRVSDDTREYVREVASRLGYRPNRAARTLVTNRTMMVGFVVPDITNPYFSEIFLGAEEVFWQEGYNVLVANTNETPARERTVLAQLDEATIDGLIVCSSRLSNQVLFPLLQRHPVVVTINRRPPDEIASVVAARYQQGAVPLMAARYLHETGRRRIGFVSLKHSSQFLSIRDFIRELTRDGIEAKREWCVSCYPTWKDGYQSGQQLLRAHPEIDAVIAGNDLTALGVMQAAKELGRTIPDDLAITGVDDILLASQVTPPLTTFHVPKRQMGAEAAHLLLRRMQGDHSYREFAYDAELVVRGST